MPSIRQRVMRTLTMGAVMMAVVPTFAMWATHPQSTKSIVLKVQMTPVDDNPAMVK